MNGKLKTSSIVILAGAVVVLLGSFLEIFEGIGDEDSSNAWGEGTLPLFTLPVLLALVMAAHVALTTFANTRFPERVLGLNWNQIHVAAGIWAAFMMLCLLIGGAGFEFQGVDVSPDKGAGFWLMLLGAVALAVGAVLRVQEPAAAAPPSTPPI
jgi:hypothetical protein